MSTPTRTGLRLAAAGTAAALALAAGAPAFAQDGTPTGDATASPTGTAEEPPAAEERPDPAAIEEVPGGEDGAEEAPAYANSYRYLDRLLEGANMGTAVQARPEFRVEEAAADPSLTAATILVFTDTIRLDDLLRFGERNPTYNAYAALGYDNCTQWDWGTTCILTDFAPEAGKTYTPSPDTPLSFEVTGEVTADDAALYQAVDVDAAGLEAALAEEGADYDLDSEDRLELVETTGSAGNWYAGYALFTFESDPALPEVPTAEEPALPVTGGSSTAMVAAAAALLAGAVVFTVLRRRKAAENWE